MVSTVDATAKWKKNQSRGIVLKWTPDAVAGLAKVAEQKRKGLGKGLINKTDDYRLMALREHMQYEAEQINMVASEDIATELLAQLESGTSDKIRVT